jgi:hypothetical protein
MRPRRVSSVTRARLRGLRIYDGDRVAEPYIAEHAADEQPLVRRATLEFRRQRPGPIRTGSTPATTTDVPRYTFDPMPRVGAVLLLLCACKRSPTEGTPVPPPEAAHEGQLQLCPPFKRADVAVGSGSDRMYGRVPLQSPIPNGRA